MNTSHQLQLTKFNNLAITNIIVNPFKNLPISLTPLFILVWRTTPPVDVGSLSYSLVDVFSE